jgi:hypothetical protein
VTPYKIKRLAIAYNRPGNAYRQKWADLSLVNTPEALSQSTPRISEDTLGAARLHNAIADVLSTNLVE